MRGLLILAVLFSVFAGVSVAETGPDQELIDRGVRLIAPNVGREKQQEIAKTVADLFKKLPEDPAQWKGFLDGQAGAELRGVARFVLLKSLSRPRLGEGIDGARSGMDASDSPFAASLRREIAEELLRRDPQSGEANRDLGLAEYGQGDFHGARVRLRRARALGERDPEVLVYEAAAAYREGDYAEAARAASEALREDPGNKEAMALYQFSKGRDTPRDSPPPPEAPRDESIGAVVPARLAPAPAAAPAAADSSASSARFAQQAAAAMRAHDYARAYDLAGRAVELSPRNAQALNFRAMALTQMRRYADAVQDASAALALAPGSAAALQTRSWAFAKQGKYREALQDADATLWRDASNAYAYQNKAFALAGLGDREGALQALRRSAQLEPRFASRLERALQLPQDKDLTLLFDDPSGAAPARTGTRRGGMEFLALSAIGGLLVALAVLHIFSGARRGRIGASGRGGVAGAFWTQYELVKEIGLGGMGVVYEARDRALERRVAVKKMRDEIRLDPKDRQRFINEARLVAQLHHPNITDIYGIIEEGADVYLVFEFVEGRTLEDALKSGGPMEFSRARAVLREMAAAVEHAHEHGIIHRDLKPSNVMLASDGRVKVMDFGVARQAKDALTRRSATVAGTPPYMAPEQEQGAARPESDVYALGVCFYEMLTGHLPFGGSGSAMLLNKLNGRLIAPSRRVASLPPQVDAVVAKALAADPAQRYKTPAEFAAALAAAG